MENTATASALSAATIADYLIALYGDDGRTTWLSDRENISKENALKLARSHTDLLSALEGLIDVADDDEVMDHDFGGCENCALCDARRAVAKAKGDQP